jgi:hypothetical protein
MTYVCDRPECGSDAARTVQAEGLTVVKRICATDGACLFWVRIWFAEMYPQAGGRGLSYEPIRAEATS